MTSDQYPAHNRQRFFKYTSAETAVKILESSAVLYRSPAQFNDPFDVQSGLHFDFDIADLPDKSLGRIEELVLMDSRPDVSVAEPFGQAILLMWEKKQTHGFPKDRFKELFRPNLASFAAALEKRRSQYQLMWRDDFLPRLRVFSVSEDNDNLLMWSHYADQHKGVVIEFRVLPDADNPLCIAKPIQYRRKPPPTFSEKELIEATLSERELDPSDLLQYAYMKSDIWTYEKEWRVWDLLPKRESQLYSFYPLVPGEIGAVYFGCTIDPEKKAAILTLLSSHTSAGAFQASKAVHEFKLDFTPL